MVDTPQHWLAELERSGFRGKLEPGRSLASLTTFRIGGPVELLATPASVDDLEIILSWASRTGVFWRILGNGSNILVRDQGVDGVVIRLRRVLDEITLSGTYVDAGAGASFPALARRCAGSGLAGLEFAAGIPGTVGGAIVMNAGWHEFEIGNHVTHVDWIDASGRHQRTVRDDCDFSYRRSRFRDARGIVVAARLQLAQDEPTAITRRLEQFAASRKRNQPTELPSCGSVFLKPAGDFAGRLIEEAGLKGHRIGDAEISTLHANFFVNRGHATAEEMLQLVQHAEAVVLQKFGVQLVREFELW